MKNICIALSVLLVSCLSLNLYGQQTFPKNGVYDQREGHYLFTNATIYISFNQKVENASLLIKEGKVLAVGAKVSVPKDAVVIDLKGKSIYPSFIDLYTEYGIPETARNEESPSRGRRPQPNSKKTGAYSWNQSLNAEYHAEETFSAEAKQAAEYRSIGFGTVLTHRMDGISRGSGAVVLLGDEREHVSILKGNATHHLSFRKGSSRQSYPSSLMGAIALLRQTYYDSDWYLQNGHQEEKNISLEAWNQLRQIPQIFEVGDKLEALRALRLGNEFGISYIIKGIGDEYQRLSEFTAAKNAPAFILPLNFPEAYDATDPYDAILVSLQKLKHWEMAPSNPARLAKAGVNFSLTSHGLKKKQSFLKHLRKAIEHNLSEEEALKALTATPAQLLGVDKMIGSLEKGKLANFIITSGNIFEEGSKIHHNWVKGKAHAINEIEEPVKEGLYDLILNDSTYNLHVRVEKNGKQKMHIQVNDSTTIKIKSSNKEDFINLSFVLEEGSSAVHLSGIPQATGWTGHGTLEDGRWAKWSATYRNSLPAKEKKDKADKKKEDPSSGSLLYPFTAFGWEKIPTQKTYLIKGATVWTNEAEGILENTDVLIQNGKISKLGKDLNPKGKSITTIDGKGKHLTCGIIDEHSHIAISRGTNEGTQASSAEVRIGDVLNSEDINIYRQLSGGVTTSQILHGSANPIGGQSAIIKLRWGYAPEKLKFEKAAPFIKFALGENVKQSNWGDNFNSRFPQTRMGVEQVFEDYLTRAKAYGQVKASGQAYRRDLDLEALLEVVESKRFISCHSYQQSEVNMLMKVADRHGFTVNTFTHILEGYKVADKMAEHGAAGSTFSDWWAYKYEVIDAIPYNAAIMHENKVLTSINSDDVEMGRRLNQEAAKAVMYGNVSEEEAWKFVTLNPAKMLHIDQYVGSIKEGKDADIVLWSDHPLSVYSRAELTFVDGIKFFDRIEDRNKREDVRKERNRIIQKMTEAGKKGAPTQQVKGNRPHHYHCDDIHDEMGEEH